MPILRHDPRSDLPWQWHAEQAWRSPHSNEMISYLSGFKTEEAARTYGRLMRFNEREQPDAPPHGGDRK